MRTWIRIGLIGAVAGAPLAVAAQETPTRSVDDYVCTFAGNCEDANADDAEVVSDEPQSPRGTPRTSATRGFSLARPNAPASSAKAAPKATTKAAAPARRAGSNVAAQRPSQAVSRPPAAAQGQRADLRLTFALGSATLTPMAQAEARVFAQSLLRPELSGMRFLIEGHTDSVGGRDFNLDLSQRRAEAVADYLASQGVPRSRLDVRGYGFDRPLPGRSAAAQENRRVEAVRTS